MSKPHADYAGFPCLHCGKKEGAGNSFFCSPQCRNDFMEKSSGPVRCSGSDTGGDTCKFEAETIAKAKAAGWTSFQNDPEGICWNYTGICPECSKAT